MGSAPWSWCVQSQARVAARSLSTRGSVCVSVGGKPGETRAPRCCASLSTATFPLSVGVSFWFCPSGHIKFLLLRSRWHGDFHIFLHCSKPQRSGVERPRMCQCTWAEWSHLWVSSLSFLELD